MIAFANKPISKHELKHVTRKEILLGLRKITEWEQESSDALASEMKATEAIIKHNTIWETSV